jgi:hypothetical protein
MSSNNGNPDNPNNTYTRSIKRYSLSFKATLDVPISFNCSSILAICKLIDLVYAMVYAWKVEAKPVAWFFTHIFI